MYIAILSDIHGDYDSFQYVVDKVLKQNIDKFIFLGDLATGVNKPNECFNLLSSINPVVWIKGNTDEWLSDCFKLEKLDLDCYNEAIQARILMSKKSIKFIKGKKNDMDFHIDNHKIYCTHDLGINCFEDIYKIELLTNSIDADLILYGHTHIQSVIKLNNRYIINPGSVSDKNYAIVEIKSSDYSVYLY